MSRASRSIALALAFGITCAAGVAQSPKFQHVTGGQIEGVFFLNNSLGWTAEDGGRIRHTSDGGSSWTLQATPDSVLGEMRSVFFLDSSTGWAVGDGGVVLQWNATQQQWNDLNPSSRITNHFDLDLYASPACGEPAELWDIHMFDEDNGWIVGTQGVLVSTSDNWTTWSYPTSTPVQLGCDEDPWDLYQIHFFADNPDRGFIVADHDYVYLTTGGTSLSGATWTLNRVTISSSNGVCPYDPGANPPNIEYWAMSFDDPSDSTTAGWIVGGEGTQRGYMFRLNSVNWSTQSISVTQTRCYDSTNDDLVAGCGVTTQYGVASMDGSKGVCVGYESSLYEYNSGGTVDSGFDPCSSGCCPNCSGSLSCSGAPTWNEEEPGVPAGSGGLDEPPFMEACKISTTKALLTGRFGRIVLRDLTDTNEPYKEKGGTNFMRIRDGAMLKPSSGDPTSGCVIGTGYMIRKTTNSGVAWTKKYPSGDVNANNLGTGIDFSTTGSATTRKGLAVGTGGFVVYSVDSGDTWTLVSPALTSNDLQAVAFVPGSDVAYIVGSAGFWGKVTGWNSGVPQWSTASLSTSETLNGVAFADDTHGYIVGNGSLVYYTSDGTSWNTVPFTGTPPSGLQDIETWGNGTAAVLVGANQVWEKGTNDTRFHAVTTGLTTSADTFFDIEELGSGAYLRICGADGVVLFYDSGTWSQKKSHASEKPLYRLSFPTSESHGYAFGQQFEVTRYSN